MSDGVWLPESSVTEEKKKQEPTPGTVEKKRVKIRSRTTPTVDIRVSTANTNSHRSKKKTTYSTIEGGSYSKRSLYLALNSSTNQRDGKTSLLCGWKTENDCDEDNLNSTALRSSSERTDPRRSCPPSRLGTRAGRKPPIYVFTHLPDSSDYLQEYCTRCSYSARLLARDKDVLPVAKEEKEEKKKRKNDSNSAAGCAQCLVKCNDGGGRGGREEGRLEQLASKLGVHESIQEGQLHYRPRPTPPSFTRKTRIIQDIIVSSNDQQKSQSQVRNSDSLAVNQDHQKISSEQLTGEGLCTNDEPGVSASIELPSLLSPPDGKITTILSNSLVTKYLGINRRPTLSHGLGEEESVYDVPTSSRDSLPPPPLTRQITTEEGEQIKERKAKEEKEEKRQKFLLGEDVECRERVLTQKAQVLGLLSRDWGQARLVKKLIAADISSRPCTRGQNTRPPTRARNNIEDESVRRPYTKADRRQGQREEDSNGRLTNYRLHQLRRSGEEDRNKSRPVTSHDKMISEKLDKLQTIYKPPESKSSSKQKSTGMRPATRGGEGEMGVAGGEQREKQNHNPTTRPTTRLEKRLGKLLNEGSQYWKEIPRMGHYSISQSQSRTKPIMRMESNTQTLEPQYRTVNSRGGSRPSYGAQLRPHSKQPIPHEPNYHPAINLTGHKHRYRNRYYNSQT